MTGMSLMVSNILLKISIKKFLVAINITRRLMWCHEKPLGTTHSIKQTIRNTLKLIRNQWKSMFIGVFKKIF